MEQLQENLVERKQLIRLVGNVIYLKLFIKNDVL